MRRNGPIPRDPVVRFWEKVDRGPDDGVCWHWLASRTPAGYGQFGIRAGVTIMAHRFAYEHLVGPIPEGLHLDHLCRNRACVNPEHLEPVTCAENVRRGAPATKTHCINGHALAGDNLYRDPRHGRRQCRTCRRAAMDRHFDRREDT